MKPKNRIDESLKKSLLMSLGIDYKTEKDETQKQDATEHICSIAPWIYVTDKLPKHGEVVFIPWPNPLGYKMSQFMEHGITCPERQNFFCKTSEYGFDDCCVYYNVKAWLPIPKPKDFLIPKTDKGYYEFEY